MQETTYLVALSYTKSGQIVAEVPVVTEYKLHAALVVTHLDPLN